jgi:hypothetical protein
MKIVRISLFLIAISIHSYSQKIGEILEEFKSTGNDSALITKYSIYPYEIYSIDKSHDYDSTSFIAKQIFNSNIGDIVGPFESDSIVNYVKIVNIVNAYRIRIGNIWIDIKRGYDNAKETANKILSDVKNGKDYNMFCYLYSDDKNKMKDCDIGWIYNVIMVEPFASEIIKHRLGDVFVVETKYGFHVVKILGNPYLDRMKADYIALTIKKNKR